MEIMKISQFSNFLASSPKSYTGIAQFLVMNSFRSQHATAGYIGELTENGDVCLIGGFGWPQAEFEAFEVFPIQKKWPITDAIIDNDIKIFHNTSNLEIEYPDWQFKTTVEWVSGFTIPAYPIGAIGFLCSEKLVITDLNLIGFSAIGSLLGLYATRLPSELVVEAVRVKEKIALPQVPLTDRQLVIAGMMERGFSNSQIGREIGYSESLIRQETVSIYKKLRVTGREAMQLIKSLHLEEENN